MQHGSLMGLSGFRGHLSPSGRQSPMTLSLRERNFPSASRARGAMPDVTAAVACARSMDSAAAATRAISPSSEKGVLSTRSAIALCKRRRLRAARHHAVLGQLLRATGEILAMLLGAIPDRTSATASASSASAMQVCEQIDCSDVKGSGGPRPSLLARSPRCGSTRRRKATHTLSSQFMGIVIKLAFRLATIQSEPAMTRKTMSTPKARARMLFVSSGPLPRCRKKTR